MSMADRCFFFFFYQAETLTLKVRITPLMVTWINSLQVRDVVGESKHLHLRYCI